MSRLGRRALVAGMALALLAGCVLPAQPVTAPTAASTPAAAPSATLPAPTSGMPGATPTNPPETATPRLPAAQPAEYLVLVVLDAARPDDLDAARAMGAPAFDALIQEGMYYPDAWVGTLENSTPAGHVQLATGLYPQRSGVTGHVLRNAALGVYEDITADEAVQAGRMPALVAQSGVPTLAGRIKARYPGGVVIALSGDKDYAAQALGVGPADFVLYAETDASGLGEISLRALPGYSLAEDPLADARLRGTVSAPGERNAFTLRAASVLFQNFRPSALLVTLPETDDWGHASGADPAVAAPILQKTDQALGELMEAYRRAGIFEQTLWVVTSDHGMSAKREVLDPEAILADAGVQLAEGEAPRLPLFLIDPSRAPAIAAQIAALQHPAITGVYYRERSGENSYRYVSAAGGDVSLAPVYNHLLEHYASLYTPDVIVFGADGVVFDDTLNQAGGEHSMTNWHNQHIALILRGPGVRVGMSFAPARLIDVLPTIAQVMGLDAGGMDGVVLADALTNPPDAAFYAQDALNVALAPLRDAFEAAAIRVSQP